MKLLTPCDLAHPIEPLLRLAVQAARRLQADVHLLAIVAGHQHETFKPVNVPLKEEIP